MTSPPPKTYAGARFTASHFPKHSLSFPFSLRTLCLFLCALCVNSFSDARAQDLDKPLHNIDEDITSFSFSSSGRIAYSVRHNIRTKLFDIQHDDIWIQDSNGKRRRLIQGDKFTRGTGPFSYSVDGFRWSPDGRMLLVLLDTMSVVDDSGKPEESLMTLVLEDNGKEIKVGGLDSVIKDCANSIWLLDNSTVVCSTEAVKPRVMYSFKFTNLKTGPVGPAFEGRTFLDVDPITGTNSAIAIEQDRAQSGPPRLQHLDLLAQEDKELATLDGYSGGLSVSPSGKKVAYFIDREVLEVRDLAAPDHFARLRVGLGTFQWAPGENRILLKRAPERKSADVAWIAIPPLAAQQSGTDVPVLQPTPLPILHGVTFRDFAISPGGRFLGVVAPGKRNLLVFPFPG
jgi:dipeptidyl aminopeptidase/acylaminoacyl peptidase